ncbi:hypothetical protein HDU97_001122 [Phlyctochytrium planicorne]|nr:hypothetical protein HDU97_001122 [Phlyctochytrium planicorne]
MDAKTISWLSDSFPELFRLLLSPQDFSKNLTNIIRSLDFQTLIILGVVSYVVLWGLLAVVKTAVKSVLWMLKISLYIAVIAVLIYLVLQINPDIAKSTVKT